MRISDWSSDGCSSDLNKVEKPLSQVRCDVWRGFIFINFDDNARPLEDFMAPLSKQIQDFPLDDMIVKDVITVELDCNWKTSYDNFLEKIGRASCRERVCQYV